MNDTAQNLRNQAPRRNRNRQSARSITMTANSRADWLFEIAAILWFVAMTARL